MHKRIKFLVLGTVAALTMAFAASTASAIDVSPAGNITSTSLGLVTFRSSVADVECRVTLTGTLAGRVRDEAGQHVGSVTGATANECRGGNATPLTGTAWTVTLEEEAAPNLSGRGAETRGTVELLFTNVQFLVEVIGVSCLYTGTTRANLAASGEPLVTGLVTITGTNVRRSRGSIFCPSTGTLAGTFGLTRQTLRL